MRWHRLALVSPLLLLIPPVLLTLLGLNEANTCGMTFMYRSLQFKTISVDRKSPYMLIEYIEGGSQSMLPGPRIPVLFVPGSSGSCKQVRSLATVVRNKTEMRRSPFNFDFFAVDFNEEHTFLSAGILHRQVPIPLLIPTHPQVEFTKKAMKVIAKRYPGEKILLTGHSFGGVVAHALAARPEMYPLISVIISLAAPLRESPVPTSAALHNFYEKWQEGWTRASNLLNLASISFSGGLRDFQVRDGLASLNSSSVIHLPSFAISSVYKEADHLCILWCNQLVRYTSRILFDYAERREEWNTNAAGALKKLLSGPSPAPFPPTAIVKKLQPNDADLGSDENVVYEMHTEEGSLLLVLSGDSGSHFYDEKREPFVKLWSGQVEGVTHWSVVNVSTVPVFVHAPFSQLFTIKPSYFELSWSSLKEEKQLEESVSSVRFVLGPRFLVLRAELQFDDCPSDISRKTLLFAIYERTGFSKVAEWRDESLVLRLAPLYENYERVVLVTRVQEGCKARLSYGVDVFSSLFFLVRDALPVLPLFLCALLLFWGSVDDGCPPGMSREIRRNFAFTLLYRLLFLRDSPTLEVVLLCLLVSSSLLLLNFVTSLLTWFTSPFSHRPLLRLMLGIVTVTCSLFSPQIAFIVALTSQALFFSESPWESLLHLLSSVFASVDLLVTPTDTPSSLRFPYSSVLLIQCFSFFAPKSSAPESFLCALLLTSLFYLVLFPSLVISFETLYVASSFLSLSHLLVFLLRRFIPAL